MSRIKEITIATTKAEFTRFLDRVKELTRISTTCKLRVLADGQSMLYAIIAEQNKVSKLKSYFLPITDLFSAYEHKLDLDFIIIDSKNWVKQYSFLLKGQDNITLVFSYGTQDNQVYSFRAFNDELELKSIAGDVSSVKDESIRTAPLNTLKNRMSEDAADWSIDMSVDQWEQIKRLSKLETEDLITVVVRDGEVTFEQSIYKQKIGRVDTPDNDYSFHSDNMENISKPVSGKIGFSFFSSFIVVNEGESRFMYVLELNA